MTSYLIKRILIMIPTFFVISCIVFLVLNLAPGRPTLATGSTEGGLDAKNLDKMREAYKIFNDQFLLDKPIFFNTRFALSEARVGEAITRLANKDKKNRQRQENISAKEELSETEAKNYFKELNQAENDLQDWGMDSVPRLIALLNQTQDPDMRFTIINFLTVNAQQRKKTDYSSTEAQNRLLAENQRIEQANEEVKQMRYDKWNDPEETVKAVVVRWNTWYEKQKTNPQLFPQTTWGKVKKFFLDTRFANYWYRLLRLDFGISHVTRDPVFPIVMKKVGYSAFITFLGLILSYLIAVPIGVYSAVKPNSKVDVTLTLIMFVLYALPSFFAATLALKYFASGGDLWPLFPAGDFHSPDYETRVPHARILDVIWHIFLPVTIITYGGLAALSRYARAGLMEVIRSDYIRTARAKGLPEGTVVLRHAVRNGMIPILTLLGSLLPALISGSIVIEFIFNIPGIGLFMLDSIGHRDYNAVMCVSLIASALTLVGILLSDISYALVDPRITYR